MGEEWSCYRGASLKKGEWSCYRGGQFNGERKIMLWTWSV